MSSFNNHNQAEIGDLELGISMELGAWDLELPKVCPPTDTCCASIHSGGPSPGRARIVRAKDTMKCFAICYLSNTFCYPFNIWRGMMSLRAADRRQNRPKMKNQQTCPATHTFCAPIHSEGLVIETHRPRKSENKLNSKNFGRCRVSDTFCRPILYRGARCRRCRPKPENMRTCENITLLLSPRLGQRPRRVRVVRDHKSRRDQLSWGTIIVAALGRQFRGLNLRNSCPPVLRSFLSQA